MTDVETLRALLARVEGAAGADEALDDDLSAAFGHPNTGSFVRYTASVDAALALVGRVKPGRIAELVIFPEGYARARIDQFQREGQGGPSTPALALLAALLRAKIAETDQ